MSSLKLARNQMKNAEKNKRTYEQAHQNLKTMVMKVFKNKKD